MSAVRFAYAPEFKTIKTENLRVPKSSSHVPYFQLSRDRGERNHRPLHCDGIQLTGFLSHVFCLCLLGEGQTVAFLS